jgi:ribosomal protein S18 acetylase RimI-like enzyme
MADTYLIRPAREADAGLLRKAAAETFEATFRGTCADEDLDAFLAETYTDGNFLEEMSREHSYYYLMEADGETVGFAWLARTEAPVCVRGRDPVELVRFYIRPAWQSRGAGRRLMEHCLEAARGMGFKTMYLGVWEHNYRAQRFYAHYGFRHVGEHVFRVGSDPQIDWWLEAKL